MKIKLGDVESNPHRNFSRHPIKPAHCQSLVVSFERNGVWPNVIVRKKPGEEGKYQLGYGHHRQIALRMYYARQLGLVKIEKDPEVDWEYSDDVLYSKAIDEQEADYIISELDDWAMYCAMVDENDSQQNYDPRIASENINAGCDVLEQLLEKCNTVDEFNFAVNRFTAKEDGTVQLYWEREFNKAKQEYLAGKGVGRSFVACVIPGRKNPNVIQAVLDSRYAAQRAEVAQAQADAAAKASQAALAEARAAKAKAKAEKDEQEAAKLREEAERLAAEAGAKAKEADDLIKQARKLARSGISDEVLIGFESVKHMVKFAQTVKEQQIPKERHEQLAKWIQDEDISANQVTERARAWWYEVSGRQAIDAENARRNLFKIRNSKELDDFCLQVSKECGDLARKVKALHGHANTIHGNGVVSKLLKRVDELQVELAILEEELNARVGQNHNIVQSEPSAALLN